MKYITNLEVVDAVEEETNNPIKKLVFDFDIRRAENEGAHINEVSDEMKKVLVDFFENN